MKDKRRGFGAGNKDKVNFVYDVAENVLNQSKKNNGHYRSSSVRFFDKDNNEIFIFSPTTMPFNTNGRATQLLINAITGSDTRIESVIAIFEMNIMGLSYSVIHHESRNESGETCDLLYDISKEKIDLKAGKEMYDNICRQYNPYDAFPFFGFFDPAELPLPSAVWDSISNDTGLIYNHIKANHKDAAIIASAVLETSEAVDRIYKNLRDVISESETR